ncbi:MAG: Gfo/Idh/MocA family oxidoreductase [Clostridia bacterium]|nr:Gfo/Idh/MocA family oxidoreductase [Clostridia bacterium]
MYRFALIGGGWRAQFFARTAQALPELFELTGTWMRDSEKREVWAKTYGGRAAASVDELIAMKPEFIVVSLPTGVQIELLEKLLSADIPLLLETPLGRDDGALAKVRELADGRTGLINTAEQYTEWPLYRAWTEIIRLGLIGNVHSVTASSVHGYHAVSVIRHFLGTGMEKCRLTGFRYKYPIVKTGDRSGIVYGGEMSSYTRDIVNMEFASGKTALYDFSNELYHTRILSRGFVIRGDRGEISWDSVRYVNSDGMPVLQKIERDSLGYNDNNKMCLVALTLGDRYLYRNPYGHARINDDEIAVASIMEKMGKKARGELKDAYSFEDSMRDAELSILLYRAAELDGTLLEG